MTSSYLEVQVPALSHQLVRFRLVMGVQGVKVKLSLLQTRKGEKHLVLAVWSILPIDTFSRRLPKHRTVMHERISITIVQYNAVYVESL